MQWLNWKSINQVNRCMGSLTLEGPRYLRFNKESPDTLLNVEILSATPFCWGVCGHDFFMMNSLFQLRKIKILLKYTLHLNQNSERRLLLDLSTDF